MHHPTAPSEADRSRAKPIVDAGTPYAHTARGTVAGINSITIDDVRKFIADNYTRGNLVIGLSGDYPEALVTRLKNELSALATLPWLPVRPPVPSLPVRLRNASVAV